MSQTTTALANVGLLKILQAVVRCSRSCMNLFRWSAQEVSAAKSKITGGMNLSGAITQELHFRATKRKAC